MFSTEHKSVFIIEMKMVLNGYNGDNLKFFQSTNSSTRHLSSLLTLSFRNFHVEPERWCTELKKALAAQARGSTFGGQRELTTIW